jgi:transposase
VLVDRFEMYRKEQGLLDKALAKLSRQPRYKEPCAELRKMDGVGLLVAMTFLTEMGDLHRFDNRRQVAAYLGLCPSCNESGEKNDRKGRITRQGPARLRKVLCQAAWVAVNRNEETQADYHRIRQNQKHRNKKALVAVMRKLAIKMWHRAMTCGVSEELVGRDRPSSKDFARARQRDLSPPSASPSLQPQSCAG